MSQLSQSVAGVLENSQRTIVIQSILENPEEVINYFVYFIYLVLRAGIKSLVEYNLHLKIFLKFILGNYVIFLYLSQTKDAESLHDKVQSYL